MRRLFTAQLAKQEERDCENKLVVLLDYDKFDLIKLLLKHRWKIACCTKLAQASSTTHPSPPRDRTNGVLPALPSLVLCCSFWPYRLSVQAQSDDDRSRLLATFQEHPQMSGANRDNPFRVCSARLDGEPNVVSVGGRELSDGVTMALQWCSRQSRRLG